MGEILLEEKYILEYIKDTINSFKIKNININNAKFHHNTKYKTTSSILKYGILNMSELSNSGIKKYSENQLKVMSDIESHVNGINAISLSIVGLTDIYKGEFEYDPYNSKLIDLLISSDIKASRSSIHYGNEYLSYSSITADKIKSVDIRLIKLIEESKSIDEVKNIIEKYNYLIEIASTIKKLNLDIPIRDMSNENLTIDIDAISNTKKIVLKQNK